MNVPKFSAFLSWLRIDPLQPDLVSAQVTELQRQIPLLYALLIVNAAALAYTHFGLAPSYLTVGVASLLFLASGARLVVWLGQRQKHFDLPESIALLRRTTLVAGFVAIAYVCWALKLDAYGGPYERAHVALFIAITVIGCIFCLIHLPQAALVVTVVVTLPYLVYYLQLENRVFPAMALNIFLVTAMMIQVLFNSFGGFVALVRSKADLAGKQSETQRLSEENRELAHTDSLTGLPNRRQFFLRLEAMIETSQASKERFAVGLLDLDRFKPVNDTYGHALGDRLLAAVGDRLQRASRGNMLVARLGGDEFGFLLAGEAAEAEDVGQTLCNLLAEPFLLDDIRIALGCSCGISVFPEAGDTAHALFDRADYALYNTKSSLRGSATVFSLDHETRIRSERAIEAALQAADLDAELDVHFQPIVDLGTGAVVAVEALARWTSPTLGRVGPDLFIPVAERAGLIHELTLALYRRALVASARLPPRVCLSFNLSALDIASPETVLALIATTRASGVDTSRITLELTETAVMRDFQTASEALTLLRSLGLQIGLDDFGTGYSSLGYLHRLPLDKVKMDRSFVNDIHNPAGRKIVTAILGLCQNLQLPCIVEGVESESQLSLLRELGCRLAQGYIFAKPMPIAEFVHWHAERQASLLATV